MHVAVLGGGYAGVTLASTLERRLGEDVTLTLVDERETHLVQHLLHRVVRTPALADVISLPFDSLFDRIVHRRARVLDVSPDEGRATLADGSLEFDVGAVCLGATANVEAVPGVGPNATPLKRLEHAHIIREEFDDVAEAGGRVVVGGAGLTGIQLAGELGELAAKAPNDTEVVLLEQRPHIAQAFPEPFQETIRSSLESLHVDVRTGVIIERAETGMLSFESGDGLEYDQLVWAGGIRGTAALSGERPVVRADLRLGQRTVGLGDAVRVVDEAGKVVPATAQTAVAQATVGATNVERLLDHRRDGGTGFEPRLGRYRYDPVGWVVSVGDETVATLGGSVLTGRAAGTLKTTIGASYLARVGSLETVRTYLGGGASGGPDHEPES